MATPAIPIHSEQPANHDQNRVDSLTCGEGEHVTGRQDDARGKTLRRAKVDTQGEDLKWNDGLFPAGSEQHEDRLRSENQTPGTQRKGQGGGWPRCQPATLSRERPIALGWENAGNRTMFCRRPSMPGTVEISW